MDPTTHPDEGEAEDESTADAVMGTADQMREELEATERWMRDVITRNPVRCFFGAVASGYLIGRIARRF